jgi:tRNA (guanine37-N1)-methyltransferase
MTRNIFKSLRSLGNNMIGLRILKKESESVRRSLIERGLLDHEHKIKHKGNYLIIPITKSFSTSHDIIETDFESYCSKKSPSFRKLAEKYLGKRNLKTAFDIVGDIAILELDPAYKGHEKQIGQLLLKSQKNITAVYLKQGAHVGEFRVQELLFIAGKPHKETVHKENDVSLRLDPSKVYFSSRQSTERARIAKQVKKGEHVLVMFSGIAPFVCVIAKKTQAATVTGIEKNPVAHRYAERNIRLNRLANASVFKGDVKKVVPSLRMRFDRVLMPLPRGAEDFLDTALCAIKKGGIIHFYSFLHETEFDLAEKAAKEACENHGFGYRKIRLVKCGQQGPGIYRTCLDFRVH